MFEPLVWCLPLAVAALGAWRPRAGLLLLTAALPLFGSPPGGPYLAALEVAGIAAILTSWRGGRPLDSPLGPAVAAFAAVSLLTLVPSPYHPPSWQPSALLTLLRSLPGVESWPALYTWRAAADLVLGCGLFMAVRRAFAGRSARPLALALLAGLCATLLVGLASYAGLLSLDGFRPLQGRRPGNYRLQSLFFLSGWLAEYIVMAAPLALAALAGAANRSRRLTLPVAALALAGLALTQQRGAWGTAAVQLLFVAAALAPRWRSDPARRRRAAVAAAATLILAVALLAGGGGLEPLLERARSFRSGLSTRAPLWAAAVEMAGERPLSGWGLGSFTPAYDLLYPAGAPGAGPFRGSAHNLYLHVAAERGVPGLLALALIGWAAVICLRRPRPGQELLALGLATSLVGIAVYGLVQYHFHLKSIGWLLWILLGCVALATREARAPAIRRTAWALVILALLVLPFRLALDEPPAYPGDRSFGFHATEHGADGDYRWTEGFAAERLPWAGETLVLSLANGRPDAATRPVDVTVGVNGETVARLRIAGGWERHRLEIGPPRAETMLLTLAARPTFRPFSEFPDKRRRGGPKDIRSLGIAVKDIGWE